MQLGCDPEVFLADKEGSFVSAIEKIGGSKEFPRQLDDLGLGYAVQEDNVALEFNIPPAKTKDEFVDSVSKARKYLENMVSAQYGLAFSKKSAGSFSWDELRNPRSMMFGCDPDYCAWTMKRNPKPNVEDKTLRSAGGHIHIGHQFNQTAARLTAIKYCDLYIGIPSVLMDTGELRKQLYGKAGAFRQKMYGVEYRTPSNFWIFTDELTGWVWDQSEKALNRSLYDDDNIREWGDMIQQAINENNKDVAASLVDHFKIKCLTH
jgi:hypothetical protein